MKAFMTFPVLLGLLVITNEDSDCFPTGVGFQSSVFFSFVDPRSNRGKPAGLIRPRSKSLASTWRPNRKSSCNNHQESKLHSNWMKSCHTRKILLNEVVGLGLLMVGAGWSNRRKVLVMKCQTATSVIKQKNLLCRLLRACLRLALVCCLLLWLSFGWALEGRPVNRPRTDRSVAFNV